MTTVNEQVQDFHRVMGFKDPTSPTVPERAIVYLRLRLVLEEAFELVQASLAHEDHKEEMGIILENLLTALANADYAPTLPDVADALADLDYVVAGTRLAYGIMPAVASRIADEVHRANMAKAPAGIVTRDEHGKIVKPEGWSAPNLKKILEGF